MVLLRCHEKTHFVEIWSTGWQAIIARPPYGRKALGVALIRQILKIDRRGRHNCGDGMFIDKLHMPIALQKDGVIVEPANYSLKFNSIDQKYCN